ncbi:MAG: hypothetical protein JWR60_801 [Polaromonas sp.]|nr:hypothetical protein [Polaromonas sp.]
MLSRKLLIVQLAVAGLISVDAHADELDTLQFKVGQSVQHDSNVFRLSESANTAALLGTSSRSDTIGVTTVGAKIDKSYSLQRIELDITADRYSYKRFSSLDFTAVNYAAAWRWSLTPALHGNLTADRQEYVDNTADIQNLGQVNRRTDRSNLFDLEYEVGGPWRAVAGVFERKSSSSQAFTFEGDSEVQGVEGGVRYVFPSRTSLAYRLKHGSGSYPGRQASSLFASDFKDREHEFRLDWPVTGKTTIQSRISYFDRAHEGLAARDFSGFLGNVNATWQATGKTSVTAGVGRELNSYQTTSASYYEGYRFFIAPTWKPTAKTAVKLRYVHGSRDYKGPLPGVAPIDRRDKLNLGSVALEWQASRAIQLTLAMQHDRRSSNQPGFDYKSNLVNLSVLASF